MFNIIILMLFESEGLGYHFQFFAKSFNIVKT